MKQHLLSHDEISTLCLELALLFHAGADGGSGLALLAEETEDRRVRGLLETMSRQVDGGAPLSKVFENAGAFPRDVWAMLRVGEITGRTEEALRALSRYHDGRAQTDRRLRSALLYPAILMVIMLTVIVVLLTKVLPIFNDVYASLGGQLTGIAGGLLELGRWLNAGLPVLCVLLALIVIFLLLFSGSERFRARLTGRWGKRDKGAARKLADARFAQALSLGISSGLSAEEALSGAGELLADRPAAAQRVEACRAQVAEGVSLTRALKDAQMLPPAECRLLELGFASGSGEAAMTEVARRLDRESEDALERLISRVEPAMVAVASVLVGIILLSVMLPLTHIMTAIG